MKIIANEAYIGNLVQRKETTTSAVNHERIQVKVSEQIKVEDTHEAIIDKDTFYQVQQIYQAKVDAGVGKFKGTKHLFTNVAHCEKCGKSLWYRQNREGYICGTYAKYGVKECSEHAIKEKDLENAILQDLKQFSIKLNSKDIISSMNKKVNKQKENSSIKTKNLEKTIENLKKRDNALLDNLLDGTISKETYRLKSEEIKTEIASLESQFSEVKTESKEYKFEIEKIKTIVTDFAESKSLTKEMLTRLVERVNVHEDGRIDIVYRFKSLNLDF